MEEKNQIVRPGHAACAGCAAMIAARHVFEVLGEKTIVVIPACCWSILAGAHPHATLKVPVFHCAFASAAATASGIRAALDLRKDKETRVVVWAGDGGTFDIGLQALSAAAERGEDIIYFCYDNEAYMNTGIQRSSATPWGSWTTTTPRQKPKMEFKKNIVEIMAAHRVPYAATATVAFLEDLRSKVQTAKDMRGGLRFIHILSPCVPGWRIESNMTIEASRLAVWSRVFPLYEVFDGEYWKVFVHPSWPAIPVKDYLKIQGRFSHLRGEEIDFIQEMVDKEWHRLFDKNSKKVILK